MGKTILNYYKKTFLQIFFFIVQITNRHMLNMLQQQVHLGDLINFKLLQHTMQQRIRRFNKLKQPITANNQFQQQALLVLLQFLNQHSDTIIHSRIVQFKIHPIKHYLLLLFILIFRKPGK